jgi:hypothetical protein
MTACGGVGRAGYQRNANCADILSTNARVLKVEMRPRVRKVFRPVFRRRSDTRTRLSHALSRRRRGGACVWPCVRRGARGLRAWRARAGVREWLQRVCAPGRRGGAPRVRPDAYVRSSSSGVSGRVMYFDAHAMRPAAPVSTSACRGRGGRGACAAPPALFVACKLSSGSVSRARRKCPSEESRVRAWGESTPCSSAASGRRRWS